MTNEQAKKMLNAKLECLKRDTSGTDFDCNNRNCDDCSLCYEQGNMGEQKEALVVAIKALEQEPCKDCISRQSLLDKRWDVPFDGKYIQVVDVGDIMKLPSVTPVACIATVKFSKEDMKELVNEKMKEIVVERKKERWIPCDERLPEDGELVLFSTKTDRVYEGRFFVDNTDFQWYAFRDEAFAYNNVVTAWLPLPKPYKVGSEGEK